MTLIAINLILSNSACDSSANKAEIVEMDEAVAPDEISEYNTNVLNAFGERMELAFDLYDPGTENLVNYEAYGEFQGIGTGDYEYKITDRNGLSVAVGEGIYPSSSVYRDPAFKTLQSANKLTGSHWDFTNLDEHQLSFYKWATAAESPGVKQYYTALALEKAGKITHALKAYYAVAVHYPRQIGWTYFHTPIYYGKIAMDQIEYLTRKHPELGLKYMDFELEIKNGDNLDISDDEFTAINPGRFVKRTERNEEKLTDLTQLRVTQEVGGEHVKLVQFDNGHWQIRVDGKPILVKATAYEPTTVGESTHDNTRQDWMNKDSNENGLIDGPHEAWVDENRNNYKDPHETAVGDFKLLKEMGVNALRHYHHASNKEILRELYTQHGIMAVIGDLMGMYGVGSGATWYEGTDYTNPAHLEAMRESIKTMVMEHKDEDYLLFWVLSNEGNYGFVGNPEGEKLADRMGLGSHGKRQYREMYQFANEMALMIKELDPNHPVAFSNGEVVFVQEIGRAMPDVDIFGVNAYRGKDGFGHSFWNDIKKYTHKPVFLTEYGCPAFHNRKSFEEAELLQAEYHRGNWENIVYNRAGSGAGNALGGVAYEYVDEWWKAGPAPEFDPYLQETVGDFKANFPDGWMHEEWLGLTSQGDGTDSPFMRQLRPAYNYYKEAWNQDVW